MIWNLDASWLLMAIAVVSMLSFFLGMALDGMMAKDSFGPTGNAAVITAGFFLGIFVANSYGIYLNDLKLAVVVGICSAFVAVLVLLLGKAIVARL